MGVSNFRDKLEEVWVPKDVGELEGLLLTIQNEPGKRILKHKIQQALKEKRHDNWTDIWSGEWGNHSRDNHGHDEWIRTEPDQD